MKEEIIARLLFELIDDSLSIPYMKFHAACASTMDLLKSFGAPDEVAASLVQDYITKLSAHCDKELANQRSKPEAERTADALAAAKALREHAPDEYARVCREMGVGDVIEHIEATIKEE